MKKIKMVANSAIEDSIYARGYKTIAGVDESGMGSFAGDVYVGIVVLPMGIDYQTLLPGLNDSKQKTAEERNILYKQIKENAVAYAVASASVEEIDTLNIYWARFLAVERAIKKLNVRPDYIIMDGNHQIPNISIEQEAIVKGDTKSISIAAASILAKVDRDEHIDALANQVHVDYDWIHNKSYYAPKHIEAIKKYGKTPFHRKKYISKYI